MENTVPETQAAPQKKSKLGLILGIAIPVVVVAIVVGIFVGISVNKNNKYKQAIALADDGDIAEAVAIHEELGDYKDLKLQISDCAVEEFEDLMDDASYKKLLRLYAAVTNYPDAVEEMNEMLREHVQDLMEKDEFYTASDLYDRAQKEEVAVDLVAQGIVDGALERLSDNDFYEVMDVYDLLREHEPSVKALEEALGNRFVELMESDDYAAEDLYDLLEENEIHLDAVYGAIYDRGCAMMENGEYYDAKFMFEMLGEYGDAAQKVLEAEQAIDTANLTYYLENGWFSDAMSIINEYEGDTYTQLMELYMTAAKAHVDEYMGAGWYSSALYFVEDHEGDIFDELLAVYMTYCGDSSVIADLESAVAARLELEAQGSTDYQAMLNAELEFLSKYEDMPFYDSTLGDLIDDYLDALDDQQYYVNWYTDYWYMPYYWGTVDADRIAILTSLSDAYGFAANNTELQAIVGTADAVDAYWAAWYDIQDDLRWDLDYIYTNYSDGYYYMSFDNDTDYTFSLRLHLSYTDAEGVEVGTQDGEYVAMTPDYAFEFIVSYPENTAYWTATWEFYDIYLGDQFIG